MHAYACTHTHANTHKQKHTNKNTRTHTHTRVNKQKNTHVRTHTSAHTHACAGTRVHTHTNKHSDHSKLQFTLYTTTDKYYNAVSSTVMCKETTSKHFNHMRGASNMTNQTCTYTQC